MLAIVPARGGSRGVVRKNLREIGGRPLIAHTVEALRDSGVADRLVISSDDAEILGWASVHGVETIPRPPELARPDSTISDVAVHVVESLEWNGVVGVFQPTSPLRSGKTIAEALRQFDVADVDSLASVVREHHLFWYESGDGLDAARPLFESRVNRQFARHGVLRETGAIQLVSAAALLRHRSMVTPRHRLFETPSIESDDIDTPEDLDRVRRRSSRGTVVFRLKADRTVGSGHLHHCLQLAEYLDVHRLVFLLKDCDPFVGETLDARGWAWRSETDLADDLREIASTGPRLVVNDVLDTGVEDILAERSAGYRVVNIEDLGPGARYADWVVNALYPPTDADPVHVSTGARFATLRSEFHGLPEKGIRSRPERVLVTFGGTDPSRLSERVCRSLVGRIDCEVVVVLGTAARSFEPPPGVAIRRDIRNMAEEMRAADVVVTAAGRTVYEAAATGTPVIAIAHSAREATHAHLSLDAGVLFLGLGVLLDDDAIASAVERVLGNESLRIELASRLRRSIECLGARRIAHRIETLMEGL
jgi:CMP-N-acetylneuraminic acid synthetase/spore coat polysaccharide biosynthesis predicted glycosyltransferase SpsG